MPFGDGTGPAGQGPMTGRGAGRCAGNNAPRNGSGFFGRGFGRGFGRMFGFGYNNQAPYNETTEKSWVETAINALKDQLQNLEQRRKDLDK